MLFIGQDLGVVGGLPGYNEGYADYFPMPDGVTTYTTLPSLAGLKDVSDWGSGDVSAAAYISSEAFDGVDMAIGLYIVGQTENIADGLCRDSVAELGEFIKNSGRTVYLRMGYEFVGSWNGYRPKPYVDAFRNIVTWLREDGVDNFQTVWQSSGSGYAEALMSWYPGDEYVDCMGYSYFTGSSAHIGEGILQLAREHNKPVFITESAPKRDVKQMDADALWDLWYALWDLWYAPFFEHIKENSDVIRAVSYINCDWDSQSMWAGQGWGDSRLQVSRRLSELWLEKLKELK